MEGTNALLAGVGFEVPEDHFPDEEPRGTTGRSLPSRLGTGVGELVGGRRRLHRNPHLLICFPNLNRSNFYGFDFIPKSSSRGSRSIECGTG